MNLIDLNDNKPTFDMPVYRFQLRENRVAKSVGVLKAIDMDKPETGFSRVRYALVDHNSDGFRIDEETGELLQLREFDYESG